MAAAGGFPTTEAELRKLPGIGDYTAAAIAAIAFGKRAAPIDTNVARVVARLHGLKSARRRATIRALVEAMIAAGSAGDFAQAMMDLGATICRPRTPDCPACPLRRQLHRPRQRDARRLSGPQDEAARPQRHGIAYWIERDGAVWLVRRPPKGMLGGMAALPGPPWTDERQILPAPPLAHVRHVFTHFASSWPWCGWTWPLETAGGTRSTVSTRLACRRFIAAPRSE